MTDTQVARKILLYGNSIMLAGLAVRLRQVAGLDVSYLECGSPVVVQEMDFVITDMREARGFDSILFLRLMPGALVLEIDSITNHLTVFSSRAYDAASFQDVLDVLDNPTLA